MAVYAVTFDVVVQAESAHEALERAVALSDSRAYDNVSIFNADTGETEIAAEDEDTGDEES